MKKRALVGLVAVVIHLAALTGCTLFGAAKDELEGKKTDTTNMTTVEKFQVTVGHMIAGAAVLVGGALTHGLINANTIKGLVTALDSSVPADVHADAVAGLAASTPVQSSVKTGGAT